MSAKLKERLLFGALYTGFFLVAFAFSAYLTFPYERLRDFLVAKVAGNHPGDDALALQVGELEPSWLTGVELTDVDVSRGAADGSEPATLHFDTVTVRVSVLPLLIGNIKLSLNAEVGDGSMHVDYAHGEIREIEAEMDALDVGVLGLGSWIGVPLKGSATGAVVMALDETATKSEGDIALTIEDLHVGDGKAKLSIPGMSGGLTLDQVKAGTLELVLKVTEGNASLEKLSTTGPDLKLDGTGGLRLADPLRRSRVDLQLGLKFSDAYKQKSTNTKALFELMSFQDMWKRATDADGTMHLSVGGTLQALRGTPGSASGSGSSRGRTSTRKRHKGAGLLGAAPATAPAAAPTDEATDEE
jgi:type II secretion system protein N